MLELFKKSFRTPAVFVTKRWKLLQTWYVKQSKRNQRIIAVIAVLFCVFGIKALTTTSSNTEESPSLRSVTMLSLGTFSPSNGIPLVGTVTSLSEARVKSEAGGRLVRVYKKLGDQVSAGMILAEIENSTERANLLQAEGVYEQAKATRDITKVTSGEAGNSLSAAKNQTVTTLSSIYATMDDAIHGKTDSAFSDPRFETAKLLITIPDASLINSVESKRKSIEEILKARELRTKTITEESDLIAELNGAYGDLTLIKQYIDTLALAYTKAVPDSAFSQQTLQLNTQNVQSARQALNGALASVTSSKQALQAAITAQKVAGNGASTEGTSLTQADAQVKQALGAYNRALSSLEKTIIRSPINGTLNTFSLSAGDYINAMSDVAIISNNNALEIVAYSNEDDAKRISVGTHVLINDSVKGIVTRKAEALDTLTRKIEVRIGIEDKKTSLINGQSVHLLVEEQTHTPKPKQELDGSHTVIIPISSLKLTPRGANVFVITSSNTLQAIPVQEGTLLGERIEIKNGLTGEEVIVRDARGLTEGMHVTVVEK